MFDKTLKNIILLRHGSFSNNTENLDFTGFMQAMVIAKYLRDNKYPLPNAFIASVEKRTIQMSKIISSSLTRNEIPILQEMKVYNDAIFGIKSAFNNLQNELKKGNFIICVSHQPGIELPLKKFGYNTSDVRLADAFLISSSKWENILSFDSNVQIKKVISPAQIRFYDKPEILKIEEAFKEKFTNGDIDKIPVLLEYLRNNQDLRKIMIEILNSSVNSQ